VVIDDAFCRPFQNTHLSKLLVIHIFLFNTICFGSQVLRSARMWYPGVQQFWDLPIQVKHNIMSEGALSPGDILPDLSLYSLDSGVVKLRKTGIQVILASSYS